MNTESLSLCEKATLPLFCLLCPAFLWLFLARKKTEMRERKKLGLKFSKIKNLRTNLKFQNILPSQSRDAVTELCSGFKLESARGILHTNGKLGNQLVLFGASQLLIRLLGFRL